jgi:hypothetical protein
VLGGGQNCVKINENTKQHGYGIIYSKIIAEGNYNMPRLEMGSDNLKKLNQGKNDEEAQQSQRVLRQAQQPQQHRDGITIILRRIPLLAIPRSTLGMTKQHNNEKMVNMQS